MKCEGGERKSYEGTCGQSLLGRGTSKCKGPGVATYSGSSEARDSGEWQQAKPLEAVHAWLLLVLVMKTHMLDLCQSPRGRAVTCGTPSSLDLPMSDRSLWSLRLIHSVINRGCSQEDGELGWGMEIQTRQGEWRRQI